MKKLSKIIAVVGTTASGKTGLAIELAKEFNGEVISADSRQIYREMDIGTAKEPGEVRIQSHHRVARRGHPVVTLNSGVPGDSPVSLVEVLNNPYMIQEIPHYMINVANPDQVLTLAHFQKLAFGIIEDILSRGKLPILAGGTGLYTSAIVENWQVPEVKPDIQLREELEKLPDTRLVERLKEIDSDIAEEVDLKNRRRVIRAIEIHTSLHRAGGEKAPSKYDALLIGYTWPREVIYDRINKRVDRMVEEGLVDEVRRVGEKYGYDTVAMTGHAYQQIGWHLQGKMTLEEALEETKKATRHYAKRQLTWWRKHGPVEWAKNKDEAIRLAREFLR